MGTPGLLDKVTMPPSWPPPAFSCCLLLTFQLPSPLYFCTCLSLHLECLICLVYLVNFYLSLKTQLEDPLLCEAPHCLS